MEKFVENKIKSIENRNIKTGEVDVIPVNTGVLLKFYDNNPYDYIERSDSGLLLGIENSNVFKSDETGEYKESEQFVACAEVIAVGNKCQSVQVGDDVFCMKSFCAPVPFRRKGYYILSEQNITCRITKK